MKINIIIISILFLRTGTYCLLLEAMEEHNDPLDLAKYIDTKFCKLDSIAAKIAIQTCDESGVKTMDEKLISQYDISFSMLVCKKMLIEFERRDVVIALLNYKFSQNYDKDFELYVYLIHLFIEIKDDLDESETGVLYKICKELSKRLENLFMVEQKQFDNLLLDLNLDLKAKEIIEKFKNFRLLKVGRLYENSDRRESYDICNNSEELLKQVIIHIFAHFEEYLDSTADAIELIEFLFPEKKDLENNSVIYPLWDNLVKGYPRLVSLANDYEYLRDLGPKILEFIFYLPTIL